MAKKITYLLGAGASANAIPVVANMHERMKEVALYLYRTMRKYVDVEDYTKMQDFSQDLYNCLGILDRIYNDLVWLIKEAENYYTIDTLAKKFYLGDDFNNLKRLKKTLITYFTLEQIITVPTVEKKGYNFTKERIDKRYGSFLAAITTKRYPISGDNHDALAAENLHFGLNNQIRMLSWNYDMQFEIAMNLLLSKTVNQHIKREFQIFPNRESKNEVNKNILIPNRFAMVKLNGDAVWHKLTEPGTKNIPTIFDLNSTRDSEEQLLINFLQVYLNSDLEKELARGEVTPSMSFNFAWENDPNFVDKYCGHGKNLEAAEQIASETEILVVIGYSFPIFNREIDNRLFRNMKKLRKVYVQDKDPEAIKLTMENAFEVLQKMTSRLIGGVFQEIPEIGFHLQKNTDQFIIPFELNQ